MTVTTKRKYGDRCRVMNGAPARYLGDGMALWVSSMDGHSTLIGQVVDGDVPDPVVLASDDALYGAWAMYMEHGRRLRAAEERIRLLTSSLNECVTRLRHVYDGDWQPKVIAHAEALLGDVCDDHG